QARWKFGDWGVTRRERQLLVLAGRTVDIRQEEFIRHQAMLDAAQRARIETLSEQLEVDDRIIALQESVAASGASGLEQGTMTATEYLIRLNAACQARLQKMIRQTELRKAEITIDTIHFNGE